MAYVNERHESLYLYKKREGVSPQRLRLFSPTLTRSISDSLPTVAHPFLEPNIFSHEVHILGALKDYIDHLEEIKQREMIQEILIVSICQPGIRYSNHPELIHDTEPPSPIKSGPFKRLG